MKIEEAIKHAKEQKEIFGGTHGEFLDIAIQALEKQIPKQPKEVKGQYDTYKPVCPVCGNDFLGEYCDECGQKIEW